MRVIACSQKPQDGMASDEARSAGDQNCALGSHVAKLDRTGSHTTHKTTIQSTGGFVRVPSVVIGMVAGVARNQQRGILISIFLYLGAKLFASVELRGRDMTESAQNPERVGLTGKIFRNKELADVLWIAFPVLGMDLSYCLRLNTMACILTSQCGLSCGSPMVYDCRNRS